MLSSILYSDIRHKCLLEVEDDLLPFWEWEVKGQRDGTKHVFVFDDLFITEFHTNG